MRTIFLIIIATFPIILFGQNKDYKSYDKAFKFYQKKQYEKAINISLKLIQKNKNWKEPYLLLSSIYYQKKDINKSADYLLMVYNEFNRKNIKGLEKIAQLYYRNGYYEKAHYYFNKVFKIDSIFCDPKTSIYISNCSFALNQIRDSIPLHLTNLGGNINSEMSEYINLISLNSDSIIITRNVEEKNSLPQEDFYSSKKINNNWSKAVSLSINTYQNEGAMTLSPDQSMCVYTACDRPNSLGSCDLYIRFFTSNNGWSREYNLGSEINSKYWETQPCFSSDGKYLYFVSNRPEGFGGKDIWRCQIFEREFTNLVNLGPNINTKYNEVSPFLYPDNLSLYFSSDGHIGMGDYDLFVSKRKNSNTEWNIPENLGYPINTFKSENSLIIASDGQTAFISSDHSGYGKEDIFSFTLPNNIRSQKVSEIEIDIIQSKTGSEIILTDVTFSSNSYALDTISFTQLDNLIKFLKNNPSINIEIQGHTDNVGNEGDNLILSQKRAESVLNYLLIKGVKNKLFSVGYGEAKPLKNNNTKKGRSYNRRTSFIIL